MLHVLEREAGAEQGVGMRLTASRGLVVQTCADAARSSVEFVAQRIEYHRLCYALWVWAMDTAVLESRAGWWCRRADRCITIVVAGCAPSATIAWSGRRRE